MEKIITLGWREWLALPDLGVPAIKAKVDTGAKTSTLHAFRVERFQRNQRDYASFTLHPLQGNDVLVLECEAPLLDQRIVSDSGGHRELRYVIETRMVIGGHDWPIELTLTNRDSMRFRMLLGRRAITRKAIVDPSISYALGKLNTKQIYQK